MKSSRSAAAAAPFAGTAAAVGLAVLTLGGPRIVSAAHAAGDTRWGAGYFPNVALTTHEGKTVRFFDDLIEGKIVAIDLIYTTCQYACPLETARLAQVQRLIGDRMGRDVFFYSITTTRITIRRRCSTSTRASSTPGPAGSFSRDRRPTSIS
jgi:cytochrome oxidase Cu insertion factor (SCO1/SenC/PrrC family)